VTAARAIPLATATAGSRASVCERKREGVCERERERKREIDTGREGERERETERALSQRVSALVTAARVLLWGGDG